MERFAFKIDKVLRANLYKICRLCGIDNPEKIPILPENETEIVNVDEPELCKKISSLIGFDISKNDKMPQMICTICVDKINDFYEFREMCYATNIQTRKLLGIKETPKKNTSIKVEIKTEPITFDKRGRKRKSEDTDDHNEIKAEEGNLESSISKKRTKLVLPQTRTEIKTEAIVNLKNNSIEKAKFKHPCNICNERFKTKYKVDRHKSLMHHPNIPRFFCSACDETLKKTIDIKDHQLWHRVTKTPYICNQCNQKQVSMNLFTRHLREHSTQLKTPITVLDRVCGQCHLTFFTNFLYNIHPCVMLTQICGGCSIQMTNSNELFKHISHCREAYLIASKHIFAAAEPIRIKNENDIEAAIGNLPTVSSNMTPVVALTRLPIEANHESESSTTVAKTPKKSSKKGISKKDLKRIDDLLKSTMNALVSIKQEPEMHMDADADSSNTEHINHTSEHVDEYDDDMPSACNDDFHDRDDESSDAEIASSLVPIVQLYTDAETVIKQEPPEGCNESATPEKMIVNIKKEMPDSGYEDNSNVGGSLMKMPVLKLKITKEHGMLNSLLINDTHDKKKKKKKRKDAEKILEENCRKNTGNGIAESERTKSKILTKMPLPGIIHIKQERFDDGYNDIINMQNGPEYLGSNHSTNNCEPGSTVENESLTSVAPTMQFQISSISSGVEFNAEVDKGHQEDIKPNRAELDRWLQENNSATTSSVSENERIATNAHHISGLTNPPHLPEPNPSIKLQATSYRRKEQSPAIVCHDTSDKREGEQNAARVCQAISDRGEEQNLISVSHATTDVTEAYQSTVGVTMPMIIAVRSGVNLDIAENEMFIPGVKIKTEPQDTDYGTEETEEPIDLLKKINNFNDEQAYINSIDFNSVNIKQEKEIDVSESQIMPQYFPKNSNMYNNAHDDVSKCFFEQSKTSRGSIEAEDEEEDVDMPEKSEKREYRELDWPPPNTSVENDLKDKKCDPNNQTVGLKIASVCSQSEGNLSISENVKKTDTSIGKIHNSLSELRVETLENTVDTVAGTTLLNSDMQIEVHALGLSNTIILNIAESAETLTKAQEPSAKEIHPDPICGSNVDDRAEPSIEEHQNILNDEVAASNALIETIGTSTAALDDVPSSSANSIAKKNDSDSISSLSQQLNPVEERTIETKNSSYEETENLFNENLDLQRPTNSNTPPANLLLQRPVVIDNRNVNEIAENNNNANIEREFFDDGATSVVENELSTDENSTSPAEKQNSDGNEIT